VPVPGAGVIHVFIFRALMRRGIIPETGGTDATLQGIILDRFVWLVFHAFQWLPFVGRRRQSAARSSGSEEELSGGAL
jgi:hypothetical protein